MSIIPLASCPEFTAGDGTVLREMLHPDKSDLSLRYSLAHARLPVGKTSFLHTLAASEVYYILQGSGRMEIDGQSQIVSKSDTVYIAPNAKQSIESLGPDELQFLCIVDPAWKAEDETVYKS